MIIFLYGKDSYRLKQNLEKIAGEYKKKYSGLAFFNFDFGEPGEPAKFEGVLKNVSFFNEKKLVIVKNPFTDAGKIISLAEEYGLPGDKHIITVFMQDSGKDELAKKDKKLFLMLSDNQNIVKLFEPMDRPKLENWLVKEIRSSNFEIEKNALKKLADSVIDPNQKKPDPSAAWRLSQELNKLINYKMMQKSKLLSVADVDLLVSPREDINIFQLIDAIAVRNRPRAISILHRYLDNGEDPYYIFSMILYQWRNLLKIKSLTEDAVPYRDMVKVTGLNPFVLKKTYDQCAKYELRELKHFFGKLAAIDVQVKSGGLEMSDAVCQFAASI